MSGKRKRHETRPVYISTGGNGPSLYVDDWKNIAYSVIQKEPSSLPATFVVEIGLKDLSHPLKLEHLTPAEKKAFCDAYASVARR